MVINLAAWKHNRGVYEKLLRWIADAAAEDFPEATRVRVAYLRGETPSAAQLRAGERGEDKQIRVVVRELGSAP